MTDKEHLEIVAIHRQVNEELQREIRLLKIRNSMLTKQIEEVHRRYAHIHLDEIDQITRYADLIDTFNHFVPMLIKENRKFKSYINYKERQVLRG